MRGGMKCATPPPDDSDVPHFAGQPPASSPAALIQLVQAARAMAAASPSNPAPPVSSAAPAAPASATVKEEALDASDPAAKRDRLVTAAALLTAAAAASRASSTAPEPHLPTSPPDSDLATPPLSLVNGVKTEAKLKLDGPVSQESPHGKNLENNNSSHYSPGGRLKFFQGTGVVFSFAEMSLIP